MNFVNRLSLLGLVLAPFIASAAERAEVDFAFVREQAKARAEAAYAAPSEDLPKALASIGYDRYRSIRFAPEHSFWRDDRLPFTLQFFHLGGLFRTGVKVHEFSPTHVQEIPFSSDLFDYGPEGVPGRLPASLGYAGFRVHAPINRPEYYDEVLAFLGASYFRAVAAGQVYGLSARGIAVNSGVNDRPEEFPRFTDFWIGKPQADDTALTIYALLDGPSVAAAYQFIINPGETTLMEVKVAVFARQPIETLGIAPLTSMFWYGENTDRPSGQPRPEVHDSDGLLLEMQDGATTWRPLRQVGHLEATSYPIINNALKRFGLFQRDRDFGHYEDPEARYDIRPSAWVEPVSGFEAGGVRLVELTPEKEYGDNIVAYWVPAEPVAAGQMREFSYRLAWANDLPVNPRVARVNATWQGKSSDHAGGDTVWIDFVGEAFADLGDAEPTVDLQVGAGVGVRHQTLIRLPKNRGWRVALQIGATEAGGSTDMSCRLLRGFEPLSERWSYTWQP